VSDYPSKQSLRAEDEQRLPRQINDFDESLKKIDRAAQSLTSKSSQRTVNNHDDSKLNNNKTGDNRLKA
jgi:hypothetical protein